MPTLNTYNLFISHSWTYSNAYDGLENLLHNANYFNYKNYSIPKDDPIHTSSGIILRNAIEERIKHCNCVIVLAGVYSTYSKWINIEIDIAKNSFTYSKPIIAIQPWGAERTSSIVKDAADRIVGWNTSSIVSAIRELA